MASIKFEKLSIPLWSLKEGISSFTFYTSFPDLFIGEGRSFPNEIIVRVQVTGIGDDFLIDLDVESEGEFVCDRCGENFRRIVNGKIKTLFTYDRVKSEGDEDDEVKFLSPSVKEINISQETRDALVLSVSAKYLCMETCLGLCSGCGVNLNKEKCSCTRDNMDPRWEALKSFNMKDS